MAWCEAHRVDYLLGLAKNERLKAEIEKQLGEAKAQYQETGRAARCFMSLSIRRGRVGVVRGGSWPRPSTWKRRESAVRGDLSGGRRMPAQVLYEQQYCARGDRRIAQGTTDAVQ